VESSSSQLTEQYKQNTLGIREIDSLLDEPLEDQNQILSNFIVVNDYNRNITAASVNINNNDVVLKTERVLSICHPLKRDEVEQHPIPFDFKYFNTFQDKFLKSEDGQHRIPIKCLDIKRRSQWCISSPTQDNQVNILVVT
jgi:hypothetical protein